MSYIVWVSEAGFSEQDAKQHMIMQNIARGMRQHGQHILPINENSRDDPVEFSNAEAPTS